MLNVSPDLTYLLIDINDDIVASVRHDVRVWSLLNGELVEALRARLRLTLTRFRVQALIGCLTAPHLRALRTGSSFFGLHYNITRWTL